MPTPLKRTENMAKHLTKAEIESRKAAEGKLRRPTRVTIRAPKWLTPQARRIFDATKRQMRGLELLDNVDAELLALYADAVARYQSMVKTIDPVDTKAVQAAQSWSRLALSFSEKLGISPTARARLAKKKAEQAQPDDMELLLDDVRDFMNGDV